MSSICIYSNKDGINSAFVKANSSLASKIKRDHYQSDNGNVLSFLETTKQNVQCYEKLRELWKEEYDVIVDENWSTLTFKNTNSLDLFLLRWS